MMLLDYIDWHEREEFCELFMFFGALKCEPEDRRDVVKFAKT